MSDCRTRFETQSAGQLSLKLDGGKDFWRSDHPGDCGASSRFIRTMLVHGRSVRDGAAAASCPSRSLLVGAFLDAGADRAVGDIGAAFGAGDEIDRLPPSRCGVGLPPAGPCRSGALWAWRCSVIVGELAPQCLEQPEALPDRDDDTDGEGNLVEHHRPNRL